MNVAQDTHCFVLLSLQRVKFSELKTEIWKYIIKFLFTQDTIGRVGKRFSERFLRSNSFCIYSVVLWAKKEHPFISR